MSDPSPYRPQALFPPERWAVLAPLIDGALDLSLGDRGDYFDRVTGDDPELRRELETLVKECEQNSALFERCAAERFPLLLREADPTPPELLGDRFAIEREIGRGGMATVFLAEDRKHGRQVAVKVLRPEIASLLGAERFLREIRTAANLQHPHILPLHDSGEAGDLLFYVMPYVEGESLRDRLSREPQLPLAEAARIAREIADALTYAHARNIVHRDIKPENILLSDGHALLMDFGIARAMSSADMTSLTLSGLAIGTPAYMPPEQASGDQTLDGRADLYALGCVFYEMLAGHPPFWGSTPQEILRRHALDAVPPLRTGRPDLPVSVERVVARALAKSPADRFATAGEFRAACEHLDAPAPSRPGIRHGLLALTGAAALLIVWLVAQKSARQSGGTPGIAGPPRSVAVMPFRNVGGNQENEAFSDGLSEEIATTLGRLEGFDVRGPRSAFSFKGGRFTLREVGEKLGVEYLVDGSAQPGEGRVRVRVQLVRARLDSTIWAGVYDRPAGDVFAIQDEIARAIAGELRIHLSGGPGRELAHRVTVNPEAYELYLKGRYFFAARDSASLRTAQHYFEAAIAKDSAFALAYAGLSDALSQHSVFGYSPARISFPKAQEYANTALALDSTLAEVHGSLGFIALFYEWDWAKAAQELNLAEQLSPNYSAVPLFRAWLLVARDSLDAAVAEGRRAIALDPFSPVINTRMISFLFYARRYQEALDQAQRTADLDVTFFQQRIERSRVLVWMDRCREALAQITNAPPQSAPVLTGVRGLALARCGNRAAAVQELERMRAEAREGKYVTHYPRALILAGLGEGEAALTELEQAYQDREWAMFTIKNEPAFRTLRSHPRFIRLIRQVGLPN